MKSFEVWHFSRCSFSKAHLGKEPGADAAAAPGHGASGAAGGGDSPPALLMHVV